MSFEDQGYSIEMSGEQGLRDIELCKELLTRLEKDYPGHPWLVYADSRAGWAAIKLGYVDARGRLPGHGMMLKIHDFYAPHINKMIRDFGGELLERHGLYARGFKIEDRFIALEHGLDVANAGRG